MAVKIGHPRVELLGRDRVVVHGAAAADPAVADRRDDLRLAACRIPHRSDCHFLSLFVTGRLIQTTLARADAPPPATCQGLRVDRLPRESEDTSFPCSGITGIGYVGTQARLAFLLSMTQGQGPPPSPTPGIDRFAGMMAGLTVLLVITMVMSLFRLTGPERTGLRRMVARNPLVQDGANPPVPDRLGADSEQPRHKRATSTI